jgi:galactonate dehydratase
MKIIAIKPILAESFLFVRVDTDEGLIGYGEAGLWAHHGVVCEAVRELSEYYVGKNPLLIEHHYQVVSRNTHFAGAVLSAAMSAIDVALWDIMGKSVNLPVYQLLGGKCREKIKLFENIGGNTVEERAESARQRVEQGFLSLRMIPFFSGFEEQTPTRVITSAVDMVRAVREAIGDGIDLGLEIHRNLRPEEAIVLARELEPFKILYYEDPLAPESVEAIDYIAKHINIPIATGERFSSMYQFKDLVDRKVVSLIRPDVSLAGGYTQVKKIAGMAEAAFVGIFPHLMGSPVNNAVFAQLAAAIPNYVLMEHNVPDPAWNGLVDEPLKVENGYRILSDRPGIGIELDEEALDKFPFKPRTIGGAFHADGSVAH